MCVDVTNVASTRFATTASRHRKPAQEQWHRAVHVGANMSANKRLELTEKAPEAANADVSDNKMDQIRELMFGGGKVPTSSTSTGNSSASSPIARAKPVSTAVPVPGTTMRVCWSPTK